MPEKRKAPGNTPEPFWCLDRSVALRCYFIAEIAASAFALAVFISPALHAASASLTNEEALLMPAGCFAPAIVRGAWTS